MEDGFLTLPGERRGATTEVPAVRTSAILTVCGTTKKRPEMVADLGMVTHQGVVLSTSAGVTRNSDVTRNDEIRTEQAYLDRLYERLDRLRERADERLRAILLEAGGTPQGRTQRE